MSIGLQCLPTNLQSVGAGNRGSVLLEKRVGISCQELLSLEVLQRVIVMVRACQHVLEFSRDWAREF
jgi:hypothetical protein